jgi:hypothetical protein
VDIGPAGQALLEAGLMHLRALDEFLGGRGPSTRDARATDWAPHWARSGFLLERERKRIDTKLPHLSLTRARRPDIPAARVVSWADRFCTRFEAFVHVVPPRRQHQFDECLRLIAVYRAR